MRRAAVLLASLLGAAAVFVPGTSRAQDAEYTESPLPDAPPPEERAREPALGGEPSHMVTRFAAVGLFRNVYDLGLAGGGASFSYGGDYPVSGAFEMHFAGGRSMHGLGFADVTGMGTFQAKVGGGLRLGLGAGLELLAIGRATSGNLMGGMGLASLARAGYDFGAGRGFFVDADCAFMFTLQAVVWGPDLQLGYRF